MATNLRQQRWTFASAIDTFSQQRRNEVMLQRRPRALYPLAAVVRILANYALAPSIHTFAMHRNQENPAAVGTAEARLEKVDERHLNLAKGNGFDFHD